MNTRIVGALAWATSALLTVTDLPSTTTVPLSVLIVAIIPRSTSGSPLDMSMYDARPLDGATSTGLGDLGRAIAIAADEVVPVAT
jgi:hypothetical protein